MTRKQQHVFEQAVIRGLVKNDKQAYEAGCAALRFRLLELQEEETSFSFSRSAKRIAIGTSLHLLLRPRATIELQRKNMWQKSRGEELDA